MIMILCNWTRFLLGSTVSLILHCFFLSYEYSWIKQYNIIYPLLTKFWGYIRITLYVHLSKYVVSSSLTEEPILMKLYTVTVYNLRMCVKEENPCPKYFKWDNKRKLWTGLSFCNLTHSSCFIVLYIIFVKWD